MTPTLQHQTPDTPEARREFLRGLPESGFVPPELYVVGPTEKHRDLRTDIDAFCDRFWSLSPIERQSQWIRLSDAAANDPQSRARLRRLEPAVLSPNITSEEFTGEQGMIVLALKELCVLAPPAKAARRAAFLHDLKPPSLKWQRAAAILNDKWPEVASLDRQLTNHLMMLGAGKKYASREPVPTSFQDAMQRLDWSFQVAEPADGSHRTATSRRGSASSRGAKPASWFMIIVVISLVRACAGLGTRQDRPQKTTDTRRRRQFRSWTESGTKRAGFRTWARRIRIFPAWMNQIRLSNKCDACSAARRLFRRRQSRKFPNPLQIFPDRHERAPLTRGYQSVAARFL